MKPSQSVPILLASLPFLIGRWGCSAAIALSQYSKRRQPHLIDDKATRAEVESKLRTPITTGVIDDGSSISTYQEKVYNFSRFWSDSPGVAPFPSPLGRRHPWVDGSSRFHWRLRERTLVRQTGPLCGDSDLRWRWLPRRCVQAAGSRKLASTQPRRLGQWRKKLASVACGPS